MAIPTETFTAQVRPSTARFLRTILTVIENDSQNWKRQTSRYGFCPGNDDSIRTNERYAAALAQHMAENIRQAAFLIPDQILRTISLHHDSSDDIAFLTSLDGLLVVDRYYYNGQRRHSMTRLLQAITQLPLTDQQGDTDWTTWWLITSANGHNLDQIGYHTSPELRPDELAPRRVITSVLRAAIPHLPDTATIARHLLNTDRSIAKRSRAKRPDANATTRISLARIAAEQARMQKLVHLALHPDHEADESPQVPVPNRWLPNPSQMEAQLNAKGIAFIRDLGAIEHPLTMKDIPEWRNYNLLCHDGLWYDRTHRWHTPALSATRHSISTAEALIIQQSTPPDPRYSEDIHQAMAWLHGLTPRAARAIVNGQVPPPSPPLHPCPQANACPSVCGQLQRAGQAPHPINETGDYQHCDYHAFLAHVQNQPTEIRDAIAAARVRDVSRSHSPTRPTAPPGSDANQKAHPVDPPPMPEPQLSLFTP